MTDPHHPSHVSSSKASDESIKETFESIVIAFILAFVFRAYVVEAFVIPTGSMAPTLMGQHFRVTCSQCGYGFECDGPEAGKPIGRYRAQAVCPMCHHPNPLPPGTSPSAGDRILVHKYIYSLSDPRRWDVIVFKAPHDPDINYIKRLVGLPNESVAIVEGNIYVQRHTGIDAPPTPWLIARKSDRPRVQQAVWQPVYHTPYVPLDGGGDAPERIEHPWSQPWVADRQAAWTIQPHGGFTFTGSAGGGTLRFDFARHAEGGPGMYTYNHLKGVAAVVQDEPIEDIRLATFVQASAKGAAVSLSTTARLDATHGPVPLRARLDEHGASLLTLDPRTGEDRILASASLDAIGGGLLPNRTRRIELWYVDQQASLWLDGDRVLSWQYDLPNSESLMNSPIITRPGPAIRPSVAIDVMGPTTTIHRIELDRDLFYGSTEPDGVTPGHAGIIKLGWQGHAVDGQPMNLAADDFFVLGDNSPQSSDGRFWKAVDPWITRRMFPDHAKPQGIVPRKLLIGRAFFVYFPGPYYLGMLPVPNFGGMRFIH